MGKTSKLRREDGGERRGLGMDVKLLIISNYECPIHREFIASG